MSYSLREPEWPPVCECKYEEARDEMDREDCPFHCHFSEAPQADSERQIEKRKGPVIAEADTASAA